MFKIGDVVKPIDDGEFAITKSKYFKTFIVTAVSGNHFNIKCLNPTSLCHETDAINYVNTTFTEDQHYFKLATKFNIKEHGYEVNRATVKRDAQDCPA